MSSPQPSPQKPWLAWVALSLLLGLGLALAYTFVADEVDTESARLEIFEVDLSHLSQDSIALKPVTPNKAAIEASRKNLPAGNLPPEQRVKAVIEAFEAMSAAQIARVPDAERLSRSTGAFSEAMVSLYSLHGDGGLYALVDMYYPTFLKSFRALVDAAIEAKMSPSEYVKTLPTAMLKHGHVAGGFFVFAEQLGLVETGKPLSANAEIIVELLFRYRFFQGLKLVKIPRTLLTFEEYRELTLYRLHNAKGLSAERRLRYTADLARLIPDYPKKAVEGVIYYENGENDLARQRFQESASNSPNSAPLMTRYLERLAQASK